MAIGKETRNRSGLSGLPWGCKTSCGRPLVLVMEAAEHRAADDVAVAPGFG